MTQLDEQPPILENRASREQLMLLRHLNKAEVNYLVFGSMALNKFRPTTLINTMQLYVQPSQENLIRLNTMLSNAYGVQHAPRVPTELGNTPTLKPLLQIGKGPNKVSFYPAIAGYAPGSFEQLASRADRLQTFIQAPDGRRLDGTVIYPQLSFSDLYTNIQASTSFHKEFFLNELKVWGNRNNQQLSDSPVQKASFGDSKRVKGEPIIRDLQQIKERLDLEVVLQQYGFAMDTSKSHPNSVWRMYERGEKGNKERVAVAALQGYSSKILVDMNDFSGQSYGKGTISQKNGTHVVDVIDFIASQEFGYGKAFFQAIDGFLGDPNYAQKLSTIQPRRALPENYALRETLIREMDLYNQFGLGPLQSTAYLESRSISPETLFSKDFEGRIKDSQYFHEANGKTYHNTAFPLYALDSRIVSLDIRNRSEDGTSYKRFPEGERAEALWISNRSYELTQPLPLSNGKELPQGTVGSIYREDDNRHAIFMFGEQDGEKLRLPLNKDSTESTGITMMSLVENGTLKLVPIQRLVIAESPIDAISFKQLNPEQPGEFRLYTATAGQPGGRQVEHIQKLVNNNPTAQIVIAQDGDNAGIRFAINYLALQHPYMDENQRLTPNIAFISPRKGHESVVEAEEAIGSNRLNLELIQPLGKSSKEGRQVNEIFLDEFVSHLQTFLKKGPNDESQVQQFRSTTIYEDKKQVITAAEVLFPNEGRLLTKALNLLSQEQTRRHGQELFQVIRPTPSQKDFNQVLVLNNGRPLLENHNLFAKDAPQLLPLQHLNQQKKLNEQLTNVRTFGNDDLDLSHYIRKGIGQK